MSVADDNLPVLLWIVGEIEFDAVGFFRVTEDKPGLAAGRNFASRITGRKILAFDAVEGQRASKAAVEQGGFQTDVVAFARHRVQTTSISIGAKDSETGSGFVVCG